MGHHDQTFPKKVKGTIFPSSPFKPIMSAHFFADFFFFIKKSSPDQRAKISFL